MERLSDHERDLLDFEARTFGAAGAKEQEILTRFGLSATAYYQQLNALLGSEVAFAYSPLLVKQLRSRRQANQRSRAARRTQA